MATKSQTASNVESYTKYGAELSAVISRLPLEQARRVTDVLFEAYQQDHSIFIFGNGGSAALASHLAADFGKGTCGDSATAAAQAASKRLRVLALTDNLPLISAWANDAAYEDVFAEQLKNFLRPRDVAFGISGSGNSSNVLKALRLARSQGAVTVGFSGQGGKMIELLDHPVVIPSSHMQLIEDADLILAHMMFLDLRARISNTPSGL